MKFQHFDYKSIDKAQTYVMPPEELQHLWDSKEKELLSRLDTEMQSLLHDLSSKEKRDIERNQPKMPSAWMPSSPIQPNFKGVPFSTILKGLLIILIVSLILGVISFLWDCGLEMFDCVFDCSPSVEDYTLDNLLHNQSIPVLSSIIYWADKVMDKAQWLHPLILLPSVILLAIFFYSVIFVVIGFSIGLSLLLIRYALNTADYLNSKHTYNVSMKVYRKQEQLHAISYRESMKEYNEKTEKYLKQHQDLLKEHQRQIEIQKENMKKIAQSYQEEKKESMKMYREEYISIRNREKQHYLNRLAEQPMGIIAWASGEIIYYLDNFNQNRIDNAFVRRAQYAFKFNVCNNGVQLSVIGTNLRNEHDNCKNYDFFETNENILPGKECYCMWGYCSAIIELTIDNIAKWLHHNNVPGGFTYTKELNDLESGSFQIFYDTNYQE